MDQADFIFNPFNVSDRDVTHAIDIELRDRRCVRMDFTVVLNNALAKQRTYSFLQDAFPHHSIRAWGEIREFSMY